MGQSLWSILIEKRFLVIFFLTGYSAIMLIGCKTHDNEKLFDTVSGKSLGLDFINEIQENDSLNAYTYYSMYNGGGVGAGDINNDGLPDLFFSGNMVSSRLFLNLGNMHFKDVTEEAGIKTETWCRGVTMADINTDGYLDIYIAVADRNYTEKGRNLLYINNGDGTFTEAASLYGIDDASYSTTSAFFDYDKDGDLDLYVLNNGIEAFSPDWPRPRKLDGSGISRDRLYKNNGDNTFSDVSFEAGILEEGYGLGLGISDINGDNWPDIYCSNDFISNDLLFINNKDGTFSECLSDYFDHTSYNGMGMDIADVNNDALVDVFVLDMRPETNLHLKTMIRGPNWNRYNKMQLFDYMPQFVRNTLQLNNGDGSFSEIGRLAGIYATDWSWAPLFTDLDNDGYKDLFISTGYGRDVTDLDYIEYFDRNYDFGTGRMKDKERFGMLMGLPGIEVHNYFYKNNGSLQFEDVSGDWVEKTQSYSNGAVFVDLELDGDLDIVTNNINDYPTVYKNLLVREGKEHSSNFLNIKLIGDPLNPGGIGSKIKITTGEKIQYHEHYVSRGYKSSVSEIIHFGLGRDTLVDQIIIWWPDGKEQILKSVPANQLLEIKYKADLLPYDSSKTGENEVYLFSRVSDGNMIRFLHKENDFNDFQIQPLLVHQLSREGPGIAVADVDGNGLEDLYIGNAFGSEGKLMLQFSPARFVPRSLGKLNGLYEDQGALFFDADGDKLSLPEKKACQ